MANDPFPNTADKTTELRFAALFGSLSAVIVVKTDPLELKEGLMWINTTDRQLKIYAGGILWTFNASPVR